MASTSSKKKLTKRDNAVALAAKKIKKARQKALRASNTRQFGKTNPLTHLENESSPPCDTVAETRRREPTRPLATKANNSAVNPSAVRARGGKKVHRGEQLVQGRVDSTIGTEELEQIHELWRQLNEEREKTRILGSKVAKQSTIKMIPRPKGKYNLMEAMKLDPDIKDDKMLYNDIRASVRQLIYEGRLDFGLTTKYQSLTKIGNIARAARDVEPYLVRFENDWVTDVIIRQYVNGKRKNVTIKEKSKRKRASTSQSIQRRTRLDADVGNSDDDCRADSVGDNDKQQEYASDTRSSRSAEQHDDDISSSEWERIYGDKIDEDENDESDG